MDSKNIAKHKNDIFRLLVNVMPYKHVELDVAIKHDVGQFVDLINEDRPDLKNLGLASPKSMNHISTKKKSATLLIRLAVNQLMNIYSKYWLNGANRFGGCMTS